MPKTYDIRHMELPIEGRAAAVQPSSLDEESRTVEVVWTTGSRGLRRRFFGDDFEEELVVSANAVRMDRLNGGAPVLNAHGSYDLDQVIGVVERAELKGGKGHATLRFSTRPDVEPFWNDIRNGIIRNVSVGYLVHRREIIQRNGQPDLHRVVDWEPMEISMVPIGFDAGAQTRAADEQTYPCEIFHRAMPTTERTEAMTDQVVEPAAGNEPAVNRNDAPQDIRNVAQPAPTPPAPTLDELRAEERQRAAEITKLAQRHNMPAEFSAKHIGDGTSINEVRKIVLDEVAKRAEDTNITTRVRVTQDEGDTMREAVANAIAYRANPSRVKLDDASRQFVGMRLMEVGRVFTEESQGIKLRGMGPLDMSKVLLGMDTRAGMLSTSDFPNILANVVSKRLRNAYETAPSQWKMIARQSNSADFKSKAVTQLANLPNFKKVAEGGEFEYAGLTDGQETYALATYGRIVAITRQTLINDDMGAFDRIPTLLGRAAAELEASVFWNILVSNPTMSDGTALFHANHGNLGTAAVIAEASLTAARSSMRKQKGLAAKAADAEPLNVVPKFLIVSPDKETEAQKMLVAIIPNASGDVNVFQGSLNLMVEARITGNAWYVSADPDQIDTIEYAYLEGEEGLYTETRMGFEVDGIEVKGRTDFAAKAIDWRGLFKNPGA